MESRENNLAVIEAKIPVKLPLLRVVLQHLYADRTIGEGRRSFLD